jgi:hypothetical protein
LICLLAHWNTQELYVYLRIEIHKSYMSTCALKYTSIICLLAHWNTQKLYVYLRIEIHKRYMSTCALKYTKVICLPAHWNTQELYVYMRIEIHKRYENLTVIWHNEQHEPHYVNVCLCFSRDFLWCLLYSICFVTYM